MISNTVAHRRRKQFYFWGAKRNIHCDVAICAACMNINKVSRVKHGGGGGGGGGGVLAPLVPTPTSDSFLFPLNYTAQSSNVCIYV